jgi:hypothetical protein
MKLNVPALLVALICGSLLLPVSATSAQRPRLSKPRPSQQKTAEPQTQELQTPSLEGTYALTDPAAATKAVKDAIEAAVKGMWPFIKDEAREKLEDKNLPASQQIVISYTQADVTIKAEAGTIKTPIDGVFVRRDILGESIMVSTKWIDKKLERTFKAADGQRVDTYSLSGDGKTLTMRVTVSSPRLSRPCEYELTYKRT